VSREARAGWPERGNAIVEFHFLGLLLLVLRTTRAKASGTKPTISSVASRFDSTTWKPRTDVPSASKPNPLPLVDVERGGHDAGSDAGTEGRISRDPGGAELRADLREGTRPCPGWSAS